MVILTRDILLPGDVAKERLPAAHRERAHVADAERRAGDRAAAAARRRAVRLSRRARCAAACLQVRVSDRVYFDLAKAFDMVYRDMKTI